MGEIREEIMAHEARTKAFVTFKEAVNVACDALIEASEQNDLNTMHEVIDGLEESLGYIHLGIDMELEREKLMSDN